MPSCTFKKYTIKPVLFYIFQAKHSKRLVTFDNLELVIKLCLKIFPDHMNGFQQVLKSRD